MAVTGQKLNELSSSTPTLDDLVPTLDIASPTLLKKTTWQAIRDLFGSYFATDASVVHLAGNETITGNKTIEVNSPTGEPTFKVKTDNNFISLLSRGSTAGNYGVITQGSSAMYGDKRISIVTEGAGADIIFSTGGAVNNRMAIIENGNVGIGTSSPTQKLDVNGTIISRGEIILDNGIADGSQVVLKSSGYNDIAIDNSSGEFRIYNATLAQVYLSLTQANGDLAWKGQNWTSAWTAFSPTITWSGGGTNPSMTDSQWYYKVIGKTMMIKGWLFYSGGDRTGCTISLPSNVASTGRNVFSSWSTRDSKPFFPMAFNSNNYIGCGGFTQGAGSSELYISGTCEMA